MRTLAAVLAVLGIVSGVGARTVAADPVAYDGYVTVEDEVPTRFGHMLRATLWFPATGGVKADGQFPVVLGYSTYCPDGDMFDPVRTFVQHGYVGAVVNVPGSCGSEGPTEIFTDLVNWSGYDVVEWLGTRDWSTGKVGMYGLSAVGISQVFVAQLRPPHLATIVPTVAATDFYEDVTYRGGMLASSESAGIAAIIYGTWYGRSVDHNDAAGHRKRVENGWAVPPSILADALLHPAKDDFWQKYVARLQDIDVPVWSRGNWDDHFPRGNVNLYTSSAGPVRMLTMGQIGHNIPGPDVDQTAETLAWYDYWLKGIDNGIGADMRERPVRYYVQQEFAWKSASAWPVPGTIPTSLSLSGGGSLAEDPADTSGSDTYAYDPAQGRAGGQMGLMHVGRRPNSDATNDMGSYGNPSGPSDQRLEAADSLVYMTDVLDADVEVTGTPFANLVAASSAEDTDWVVKLVDVFPNSALSNKGPLPGWWNLVTTGWLKGTHRAGHVDPQPITPGVAFDYPVELLPTSYLFRAGHRIGVMVASADSSRTLPNPHPAVNTVFHTSRIELPVVPRG